MLLYHDIPSSKGVENALRRAKQMAEVEYTPVKRLPIVEKCLNSDGTQRYIENHSPVGFPIRGMIYSSVRRNEKYLGFNVSLETFITAVSNPNSVVYTRPIKGTGQNVHNYYGIVCSCFASYVHNLHYRTPCAYWPKVVHSVSEVDSTKLENLQLCDLVLNVNKHIAVITDIERDVYGKVHYISVTESVLPKVRTTRFNTEQFRTYWLEDNYRIFRNANIHNVTYTPNPFVHVEGDPDFSAPEINCSLMPNYGNRGNYLRGDEPVELSVFDENCTFVEVAEPDGNIRIYPVENGRVVVKTEKLGVHKACCISGGEKSAKVEWCVVDLKLELSKNIYHFGEKVEITFASVLHDKVVAWQFSHAETDKGCGFGWINNLAEGKILIDAPTASGKMVLVVVARNEFGDYASRRIPLEVEKS